MKLYVVYADDHDYDMMSQWLVGVYTSLELAEAAAKRDEDRYVKGGGKRSRHNFEITPTELNCDVALMEHDE